VRVLSKTSGGTNQDFAAPEGLTKTSKKINSAALWEGPTCRRSAARLRKRDHDVTSLSLGLTRIGLRLTTRVFYSELLLHRSAFGTRCIDSNIREWEIHI